MKIITSTVLITLLSAASLAFAAPVEPTPGSIAVLKKFRSDSFPTDVIAALAGRKCEGGIIYWTEGFKTCSASSPTAPHGFVFRAVSLTPNAGSANFICNSESGLYEMQPGVFCN